MADGQCGPVGRAVAGGVAGRPAGGEAVHCGGGIHIQDKGQIGEPGAGGKSVDLLNELCGDPAGDSLIDRGGIQEAVGNDNAPRGQGGLDHLGVIVQSLVEAFTRPDASDPDLDVIVGP